MFHGSTTASVDVRRRLLTGLLTSALSWVTDGASNTVTDDIAEPAAAAARSRTRTSASTSSVMPRQSQPHRSRIIVHIYAKTKQATEAVVSGIEKVIKEYLVDKVLDQPQDQQHIAKLTEQQVML